MKNTLRKVLLPLKWFIKLFLVKEIKSKKGDIHFRRWILFGIPYFKIYIHGIYKADQDKHLHNHPWYFLSTVLKGKYIEERKKVINERSLLDTRWVNKSTFHKILEVQTHSVYTINFMFGKKTIWGYDVDGKFVDFKTYRNKKI